MVEVHENQMVCGDSIIQAFGEDHVFHVLLLSQMQMGKSGTYWYVILNMLFDKSNNIDNVIIISGNRETELHQQVHDDKSAYRKWFLGRPEILKKHSARELKQMKVDSKKRIRIVWGNQLTSKSEPPCVIPNNTLIVWDEAHYAQSKDNSPNKFFRFNNLENLLDGTIDLDEIKARNIKLLNVSATPFSELVVNHDVSQNPLHKVIKLEPGTNYFGMEYYSTNKRLHASFILSDESMPMLRDLLLKHNNFDDPKYAIIRVTEKSKNRLIQTICNDLHYPCKFYSSVRKDIELDQLHEAPTVPTVIVISGMLRMGKVIAKSHISMVFEESTKKQLRKTDTGLQGLLGRVCGYSNNGVGFNIHIYVEDSIIDNVNEYINNYNTNSGPYCSKAMNTRIGIPKKRQLHKFAVYDIPYTDGMLTKHNNICKPAVVQWLRDNSHKLDGLTLNTEHEDSFTAKNINKPSNKGFFNIIYNNAEKISYLNLSSETCYILNDNTKIWLLMCDDTYQPEKVECGQECAFDDIYVLDKCVFKASV